MKEEISKEKSESEEWGAWKFISDMLDNPDENGIYHTSKCYEQIYDFVVEQKNQTRQETLKEVEEKVKEIRGIDDGGATEFVKLVLLKSLIKLTNK